MLPGLYSAAAAIDAATQNQDVVARNLAHVNVPGFRRALLAYESLSNADSGRLGTDSTLGANGPQLHTDFTPGAIQQTGRPLDLAIRGDGFFELEGPDGPLYTRNGVFQLNGDGELVSGQGFVVRGQGGAIRVPATTSPSRITVSRDGNVIADGTAVGSLKIVRFADNQRLLPASTTAFRAPPDMPPKAADQDVQIVQGAREMSNVVAVEELVRLLAGLRYSEASQRALRTIAELISERAKEP